ncbi:hypothetical protein BC937DRAFT_90655 [Endogone sp. FLAS-F59071]|nr:hypothetical protein BC937DRAFT_90655 [Endogone sp. FLAS-F59071]|eukprot:RUS16917.1 hypothetical protein BC937DRAFT_90655 [Endogone sp. FLAS-F59071]
MARPPKLSTALKDLTNKLLAATNLDETRGKKKKNSPSPQILRQALNKVIKAIRETDTIPTQDLLTILNILAKELSSLCTATPDSAKRKQSGSSGSEPNEATLCELSLELVARIINRTLELRMVPEEDDGNKNSKLGEDKLVKDKIVKNKIIKDMLVKACCIVQRLKYIKLIFCQNALENDLVDRTIAGKSCLPSLAGLLDIRAGQITSTALRIKACETVRFLLSGCRENKERAERIMDISLLARSLLTAHDHHLQLLLLSILFSLCPSKKLPAADRQRFAERAFGGLRGSADLMESGDLSAKFLAITAQGFVPESRAFLNALNVANDGCSRWPLSVPAVHIVYNTKNFQLLPDAAMFWVDFNKQAISIIVGSRIIAGEESQLQDEEESRTVEVRYTTMESWEWMTIGSGPKGLDGDELTPLILRIQLSEPARIGDRNLPNNSSGAANFLTITIARDEKLASFWQDADAVRDTVGQALIGRGVMLKGIKVSVPTSVCQSSISQPIAVARPDEQTAADDIENHDGVKDPALALNTQTNPPTPWITRLRRDLEHERPARVDEIMDTVLASTSTRPFDEEEDDNGVDAGEEYIQWPSEDAGGTDVGAVLRVARGRHVILGRQLEEESCTEDGSEEGYGDENDVWDVCHHLELTAKQTTTDNKRKGKEGAKELSKPVKLYQVATGEKDARFPARNLPSTAKRKSAAATKTVVAVKCKKNKQKDPPSEDTVFVADAAHREREIRKFWSSGETSSEKSDDALTSGKKGQRADDSSDGEFVPEKKNGRRLVKRRDNGGKGRSTSVALNGSPRPKGQRREVDGRRVRVVIPDAGKEDSDEECAPITLGAYEMCLSVRIGLADVPNDVYYTRDRRMGKARNELLKEGHKTAAKIKQALDLRDVEVFDDDQEMRDVGAEDEETKVVHETQPLKVKKSGKTDQNKADHSRCPRPTPTFSTTIEPESDSDTANDRVFSAPTRLLPMTPVSLKRKNPFVCSRTTRPPFLRSTEVVGGDRGSKSNRDGEEEDMGTRGNIGMKLQTEQESDEDVDEAEANKENIKPVMMNESVAGRNNGYIGGVGVDVGVILTSGDVDEQIQELLCTIGKTIALRVQSKDTLLHQAWQQAMAQHKSAVIKVAKDQLEKKHSFYKAFHQAHASAQQETRRHLNQLGENSSRLNSLSEMLNTVLGDSVVVAGMVGEFAIGDFARDEGDD